MKVNKQQARNILQKLSPEELSLYRKLNAAVGGLNEANTKLAAQAIISNWRNYSKVLLMAILMNSNMANAIEQYSPKTLDAIRTEVSADTTKTAPGEKVVLSTELAQNFESGKAVVDEKAIQQELDEIRAWAQSNPNRKYKVVIVAGESQVTNQPGYEKKGSLAQFRANEMKRRFEKELDVPVEAEVEIGKTPYTKGKSNPKDPEYKKEQFVRVSIVVQAQNVCNFNPDISSNQGTADNGYITFDEYISGEGDITIDPDQVPDRLVILDDKGNIKADTGYITTKQSSYREWKYTPAYVLQLTKLYLTKTTAVQGTTIKTITVKDYEDLKAQLSNVQDASTVGEEVGPALAQLKRMVEKGIKEFVIYDNMGNGTVKFNEKSGDSKAVVYSPLGKTGYKLNGNCK